MVSPPRNRRSPHLAHPYTDERQHRGSQPNTSETAEDILASVHPDLQLIGRPQSLYAPPSRVSRVFAQRRARPDTPHPYSAGQSNIYAINQAALEENYLPQPSTRNSQDHLTIPEIHFAHSRSRSNSPQRPIYSKYRPQMGKSTSRDRWIHYGPLNHCERHQVSSMSMRFQSMTREQVREMHVPEDAQFARRNELKKHDYVECFFHQATDFRISDGLFMGDETFDTREPIDVHQAHDLLRDIVWVPNGDLPSAIELHKYCVINFEQVYAEGDVVLFVETAMKRRAIGIIRSVLKTDSGRFYEVENLRARIVDTVPKVPATSIIGCLAITLQDDEGRISPPHIAHPTTHDIARGRQARLPHDPLPIWVEDSHLRISHTHETQRSEHVGR